MEELYKKINKILEIKFPDVKARDEMMEKVGEIMLLETLDKVLQELPTDDARLKLSNLIKSGEIAQAFEFAESKNVRMENIFEDVAKSVVVDMFS